MKNITFSVEQAMTVHVPMCVVCGDREVQIVVNSVGSGYCTSRCEEIAAEDEMRQEEREYDLWFSGDDYDVD
jgi:hypothetical protein